MTKEKYIETIESLVEGLKVEEIKSEKGNPYSGIMYSMNGKRFQIVGVKLNSLKMDAHLLDIEFGLSKVV